LKNFKIYLLCLIISVQAYTFDEFIVSDIRIVGLQRVSTGSIFNIIPITVGDKIDIRKSTEITKSLFNTEQFDDITIARDGNTLIIGVVERPSVSKIDISGNKALETEQLLESLDGVGIKEGSVYKRSTLEKVKYELVRSYSSNGRYGANVDIEEINQPRNTIEINIIVDEGTGAKIKKINIIGNEIYSDEDLKDSFELSEGSFFSFLRNDNSYSKEKLTGDIESLESFYKNRGYIKFSVESTQVSLSKDYKDIFINYNLYEGEKYKISDVKVTGDIPVELSVYENAVTALKGQTYSQQQITSIEDFFIQILGNQGYAFAEVNPSTEIDDETSEVNIIFNVNAGNRTYTRKILFTGNETTQDHVLRREMRQFEGAWSSDNQIETGKVRLERLGYFKQVEVETIPVSSSDDQVDVIYTVEENDRFNRWQYWIQ
jgi:outer membrane protein insertion porin family